MDQSPVLPLDLVYECLNFLDWKEFYHLCKLIEIPLNFKRYKNAFPIPEIVCAEKYEYLELITYLYHLPNNDFFWYGAMIAACEHNHINIIKFLHSNSVPAEIDSINCACVKGHLEMMKYLYSIGTRGTDETMAYACTYGHLEIVKYLHTEREIKFTEEMIEYACQHDHVDIVKYIHNVGFECIYFHPSCIEDLIDEAKYNNSKKVVEFLELIGKQN